MGLLNKTRRMRWGLLTLALVVFLAGAQSAFARPFAASYDCNSQLSVDVDECESLVALYNATGGESWANSTNWLQNDDPCSWHGVLCSEGHIVTLDLNNNNLTGSLPLEIGGFPYLHTLTLNDNPLTGPIPITITFLDLDLFHFQGTSMCEPADPTFQDWFSQIVYRFSSGQYCSTVVPTATQDTAQTQTAAAVITNLPWPQQTLTAMAQEAEVTPTPSGQQFSTVTLEPSPTRVSDGPTATAMIIGDADRVIGSFGGMTESGTKSGASQGKSGFFSNIPTTWLLLLLVPITLIAVGVYLELRDRKGAGGSQKKPGSAFESWAKSEEKKGKKEEKEEEKEDDDDDNFGDFDMYDFGGN